MKVLHFILGKANKDRANGVNQVVAGLAKYTSRLGTEVHVIGKANSVKYEGELIDRDGFVVQTYSGLNRHLIHALIRWVQWSDIVHLHGVFSPWNIIVEKICRMKRKPYVLTLHNGLAPELATRRGRYRKYFFHMLFQRNHIENAAGVHVLTEEEATDLFSLTRPKNVFYVPNGIDLEDYPCTRNAHFNSDDKIKIGYLGRLSPEKNLDALCEAFTSLNTDANMRLFLAGPPSDYAVELQKRFSNNGVFIEGPLYGEDKVRFISSLDLFVHPSLCDVFSIAAMEVLALGTPLLITRTSKAAYFFDRNAFYMCEPTPFGLRSGLRSVLQGKYDWSEKVQNGRLLVEERLNWRTATTSMIECYSTILQNQNEK